VGIDLVAMCVNDIICSGAKPLFFLDYLAVGKLNKKIWADVIKGIVKGCKDSGCVLLGGETAEMPGMYGKGEYDLAGFSVGLVGRNKIIDGKKIKNGNVLLGLASSGLHSNGYSLVRKILTKAQIKKESRLLLKPTTIYVKPFLELCRTLEIRGTAHITGGGFYDNIERILPRGKRAVIKRGSWSIPKVFKLLMTKADMTEEELCRTFNMGIGMVLVLTKKDAEKAKKTLKKKFNLNSWVIGSIEKGKKQVKVV